MTPVLMCITEYPYSTVNKLCSILSVFPRTITYLKIFNSKKKIKILYFFSVIWMTVCGQTLMWPCIKRCFMHLVSHDVTFLQRYCVSVFRQWGMKLSDHLFKWNAATGQYKSTSWSPVSEILLKGKEQNLHCSSSAHEDCGIRLTVSGNCSLIDLD